MIPNDPQKWTIATLSKAIRSKEVSPVEITKALLSRIKKYDCNINSFITLLEGPALKAARQAEGEIRRGKYRGPLHGIPYAAKDLFFTKDILTTCGSKILKGFKPSFDGTVIQKLAEAGAVLIGKLNMHEFAYGTTSTSPHFGPVRNPWNLERVTGGSSGGSAAAVAASFVPADRSGFLPVCAESRGSNPPSGESANTVCFLSAIPWITRDRWGRAYSTWPWP
jgi:aspartyl-tRNA(Asn)/glutamyl-tRNA(Gln) amidotransferase subunit A